MSSSARVTPHLIVAPAVGPAPDFDRLAVVYRWMEWTTFGPFLNLCRLTFLDRLKICRHSLVLGDGDGRFSARLLAINPEVRLDAVDASPSMVRELTHRAGDNANRLTTGVADIRCWKASGEQTYDSVVSHFFLDCLTTAEILALARRIRPALTDSAVWVVSEFAVPATLYGRWFARPLVATLYWAFGRLTGLRIRRLPDHASALREAGFGLLQRRAYLAGLLISELWIVDSLKPDSTCRPPNR